MNRSYWYPSKMHKAKMTTDSKCWRCKSDDAGLVHIAIVLMVKSLSHVWTHLVVLFSLEQEGGAAVHRGQILPSNFVISLAFSGFMNSEKNKVK